MYHICCLNYLVKCIFICRIKIDNQVVRIIQRTYAGIPGI